MGTTMGESIQLWIYIIEQVRYLHILDNIFDIQNTISAIPPNSHLNKIIDHYTLGMNQFFVK